MLINIIGNKNIKYPFMDIIKNLHNCYIVKVKKMI